jgi:inner membrane protein
MLGKTHIAIGLAATAIMYTHEPHKLPIALAVAGISSLLPDIDEEHSIVRRKVDVIPGIPLGFPLLLAGDYFSYQYHYLSLLSAILIAVFIGFAYFTKHRGFTHSLLGFAAFAIIMALSDKTILVPALIGYSAHLIADACTNTGIMLLYPKKERFGMHLLSTGSVMDDIVRACAIVFLVFAVSNAYIGDQSLYQYFQSVHMPFMDMRYFK